MSCHDPLSPSVMSGVQAWLLLLLPGQVPALHHHGVRSHHSRWPGHATVNALLWLFADDAIISEQPLNHFGARRQTLLTGLSMCRDDKWGRRRRGLPRDDAGPRHQALRGQGLLPHDPVVRSVSTIVNIFASSWRQCCYRQGWRRRPSPSCGWG